MSDHGQLIRNSIQALKSMIPMQSILPEKAEQTAGDTLIVPDILRAIKLGNTVPEGMSGGNIWNTMQEAASAHFLRLRYGIISMEESSQCDDMIARMAAPLFVRKPGTMRDSVRKQIYESVIYDFGNLLSWELCKQSNLETGEKYANYISEILNGYRIGGWPCGWRGEFPQGNALVYWPYDTQGEWIQGKFELDL